MTRRRIIRVATLAAVLAGCGTPMEPDPGLKLETDRSSYRYDRILGPLVTLRVVNQSTRAAQLSTCSGLLLPVPELWTGHTWEPTPFASCFPEQLVARKVAPGDTTFGYANTRSVGTFRLRIRLLIAPREERLAPVASNSFTVY